jgi:hypothetical protein
LVGILWWHQATTTRRVRSAESTKTCVADRHSLQSKYFGAMFKRKARKFQWTINVPTLETKETILENKNFAVELYNTKKKLNAHCL